jgi:hypothetical protein
MTKLYATRDYKALGDLYRQHLKAMAEEGLELKGEIAAELAWRDGEIHRLRQMVGFEPSTDAETVEAVAQTLVDLAEAADLVLTIEQQPLHPLAMGHYVNVVAVRPARVNGNYSE